MDHMHYTFFEVFKESSICIMFDSHRYVDSSIRLERLAGTSKIGAVRTNTPRMIRADNALVQDGLAYVKIGSVGKAIAETHVLPDQVVVMPGLEEAAAKALSATFEASLFSG